MSDQFDKIGNEKDNIDTDGAPVLACCVDTTATAASPLLTDTAGTATPVLPDTAEAAAPVPANHQGHHLQQQLIELMLHSLDFRIFSIELCLGTLFYLRESVIFGGNKTKPKGTELCLRIPQIRILLSFTKLIPFFCANRPF